MHVVSAPELETEPISTLWYPIGYILCWPDTCMQMPLPDPTSPISLVGKRIGYGDLRMTGSGRIYDMTGGLWVPTGQHHGPIGCTYRATGYAIGERDPFRCQTIDVGCIDLGFPIKGQGRRSKLVCKNKYKIWFHITQDLN